MIYIKDKEYGIDAQIHDDGRVELKLKYGWKLMGHIKNYPELKIMNFVIQRPWDLKFERWGNCWGINKMVINYISKFLSVGKVNVYVECPDSEENGKVEQIIYQLPVKKVIERGIEYQVKGWDEQYFTPISYWNKVEDFEGVDYSLDI